MTAAISVPTEVAPAETRSAVVSGRMSRHRGRLLRADLLTVAAWVSAAMAVTLYLAHGVQINGGGDLLTAGGIVAGLVGSDLVLVMLVLAARIPFIDRTIGHDTAMRAHRRLGKPAFFLLLAHGAMITVGYAWNDRSDVVRETAALLGVSDLLLGYVGLGLFVAVIVTSLVAVRRRLRYEVWHVIHLLSYAAVLTALPHQFSQGAILAADTWQRVYWIALYVIALGSIATFRFVEPVVQSLRHRIVVDRIERIAPDAVSIHLRGRLLDRLSAHGGQFFIWRFWTPRTWWQAHPVSLSAVPGEQTARITIRELGEGTSRLARELRAGARVSFEGPYGLFTEAARGREQVVVAASGIGTTPARALLEGLGAPPGAVTVMVRAHSNESLFLWDEIHEICRRRGWNAYTSIGPRAQGAASWLAAEDARRGVSIVSAFPHLDGSDVYICGPDLWSAAVEREAREHGVPRAHIHRERFEL